MTVPTTDLPATDTEVTFPAGGLTADTSVVLAAATAGGVALVTASTPFHPVDHGWPDQGPDRGTATIDGSRRDVIDVVLGATDGGLLYLGADIPARRGSPGWIFVVVHLLAVGTPVPDPGTAVRLEVDAAHRDPLSAGHTACHLAALALNSALAGRWRKPVPSDALGHPQFDQQAITSSRIRPFGAVDTYRIGKSLRKKGFDADGLAEALPAVTAAADAALAGWLAGGAAVRVEVAGPGLTDRREWVCELPEAEVRIPCGGTHVTSLAAFETVTVRLSLDDATGALVMTTEAVAR